jgi:hypothetical protein
LLKFSKKFSSGLEKENQKFSHKNFFNSIKTFAEIYFPFFNILTKKLFPAKNFSISSWKKKSILLH